MAKKVQKTFGRGDDAISIDAVQLKRFITATYHLLTDDREPFAPYPQGTGYKKLWGLLIAGPKVNKDAWELLASIQKPPKPLKVGDTIKGVGGKKDRKAEEKDVKNRNKAIDNFSREKAAMLQVKQFIARISDKQTLTDKYDLATGFRKADKEKKKPLAYFKYWQIEEVGRQTGDKLTIEDILEL
jgi:hypothetical protein